MSSLNSNRKLIGIQCRFSIPYHIYKPNVNLNLNLMPEEGDAFLFNRKLHSMTERVGR